MWSKGATKGTLRWEPGMMPSCGAHQRSMADQSLGNTSALSSACARLAPHQRAAATGGRHIGRTACMCWAPQVLILKPWAQHLPGHKSLAPSALRVLTRPSMQCDAPQAPVQALAQVPCDRQ